MFETNLPGRGGFEVLRPLRRRGDCVPIILLIARLGTGARVERFDSGTDDHLIKPFLMDQLEVRIRALSRRKGFDCGAHERLGELEFDRTMRQVRASGIALNIP
ncbi:response regulator [Aliiroseovarius sp. 2305UL8-7]|uniref:response regulator n=1 Tax=Aliiroseovarius conchicola TaxID=3121637 RepID=UPI00352956A2